MTELKTLKDMDFISCTKVFMGTSWECLDKEAQNAIKKELRQEAIKHIEELYINQKALEKVDTDYGKGYSLGKIEGIRNFFNIKESDLK